MFTKLVACTADDLMRMICVEKLLPHQAIFNFDSIKSLVLQEIILRVLTYSFDQHDQQFSTWGFQALHLTISFEFKRIPADWDFDQDIRTQRDRALEQCCTGLYRSSLALYTTTGEMDSSGLKQIKRIKQGVRTISERVSTLSMSLVRQLDLNIN